MDITEQQFISFMTKKNENNYGEEDLLKAFQVFDKDASGTISTAELRYVLCCLGKIKKNSNRNIKLVSGEKLDDEAVESMLMQADPSGAGAVKYEPFVRQMMKAPL